MLVLNEWMFLEHGRPQAQRTDFFVCNTLERTQTGFVRNTRPHIPAVCDDDSKVPIPRTQDPTDTRAIKPDFGRKTNIKDDQHHKLYVL